MSKADRQRAREQLRTEREAQRKREERNRRLLIVGGVLGTIALVVGAVVAYMVIRPGYVKGAPVTLQDDGSAVMALPGLKSGVPVVDIYEDPQCPACKAWEERVAPTVKKLTEEGKAKAIFHPITIFSDEPLKSNSIQAGAALRCTPGEQWMPYLEKIYEEQPPEGQKGFAPADLAAWGKEVGVTEPGFDKCVTSQQHAQAYETGSQQTIKKAGVSGTPTVKVNGQEAGDTAFDAGALEELIIGAAK